MDNPKSRSSNGTYANFLILENVLEINFHPDIILNETVLNEVEREKKVFMHTHDPLPELYDISHVERVQLEGSLQLDNHRSRMAVYTGHKKEKNSADRIREMHGLDKALFKVFQDKDVARDWLN
jgi:hypothetical protein